MPNNSKKKNRGGKKKKNLKTGHGSNKQEKKQNEKTVAPTLRREEDEEEEILAKVSDDDRKKEEEDPRILRHKLMSNPDKIDAKRLAKYAPDLVRKIEESHQQLNATQIRDLCYETVGLKDEKIYSFQLSKLICPGVGKEIEDLREKCNGYLDSILPALKRLSMKKAGKQYNSDNLAAPLAADLKRAADRAVGRFKQDIVKICFRGNRDEFDSYWEKYDKMPADEFKALVLDEVKYILEKFGLAVKDIKLGSQGSTRVCWSCGKKARDFKECSKCVAKYCNEQCQRDHWTKGGHKMLCEDIKSIWDMIKKAEDTIMHAVENPEKHQDEYGSKPSPLIDFIVARSIPTGFVCSIPYSDSSGKKPDGPSMSHFYNNIRHIILEGRQNGWWEFIMPPEPPTSAREILLVSGHSGPPDTLDIGFQKKFFAACHAMMYDYRGVDQEMKHEWFALKMHIHGRSQPGPALERFPLMAPELWYMCYQSYVLKSGGLETLQNKRNYQLLKAQTEKRHFQLHVFGQLRSRTDTLIQLAKEAKQECLSREDLDVGIPSQPSDEIREQYRQKSEDFLQALESLICTTTVNPSI